MFGQPVPAPDKPPEHRGEPTARPDSGGEHPTSTPQNPADPAETTARKEPPSTTQPTEAASAAASAGDVMRARVEALARPRAADSPAVAALRALLRDPVLMAGVVDDIAATWAFTPDQLDTLAVLLQPNPHHRHHGPAGSPRR